jgi:hypothetical protein
MGVLQSLYNFLESKPRVRSTLNVVKNLSPTRWRIGACCMMQAVHDEFPRVLNCLNILSEDKDAATSSTADSLLKNIFSFNFVLGIMTLNSVLSHTSWLRVPQPAQQYLFSIYIYYLPLCPLRPHTSLGLSRRLVPGAAVTSQCGDTLGCRVSAQLVAVWLLCEKYRYDLLYLASVLRSLVPIVALRP